MPPTKDEDPIPDAPANDTAASAGEEIEVVRTSGAVVVLPGGGEGAEGAAKRAAEALAGAAGPRADDAGDRVSRHRVTIVGEEIAYTARAGAMTLREEDGAARATIFFVAYTKDGEEPAARPITFCFNGGPGSSSVWLHLGAFGPRRVPLPSDGEPPTPPGRLMDNDASLLDLTDLVFIDPVSTGYSRAAEEEKASEFHGVEEDVRSVGEFIRLFTTRHGRWTSPKLLAGESYGTTRGAALAQHLQDRHGMFLSGLVLISTVLEFQTLYFHPGNEMPYLVLLPSQAATAHYHGRVEGELPELLRAAEDFALGDYAGALLQGDRLGPAARREIAERVAATIGLSADYVARANLRVSLARFCKELLRDERRTVGRLDSRYQGQDADAAGEAFAYDPSMAAILGPYTATLNHYLRAELGYENDKVYEILTGRVHPWTFDDTENRYLNVAPRLRDAMSRNPSLKVFVGSGHYDLATPYLAADLTFARMGLEPDRAANVTTATYPAGHMMYVHEPSLARLKRDLAGFYAEACPPDA